MSTDLPWAAIIQRTPPWVWVVLALITWLGFRQTADRHISRSRLFAAPVAFGVLSFSGAVSAFGWNPGAPAWMAGMALILMIGALYKRPFVPYENGRYAVRGSWMPLLCMWVIFIGRYAAAVTLAWHPE